MKHFHLGFLSILMIVGVGCSPLKRSQTNLVNNYFGSLTDYPNAVKHLNERVATFTLESNNLKSSLETSDSLRVKSLITAVDHFEEGMVFPDS